jgi:hypothetical protein
MNKNKIACRVIAGIFACLLVFGLLAACCIPAGTSSGEETEVASSGKGFLFVTPAAVGDNARSACPDFGTFDYLVLQMLPNISTPFGTVTYNYDGTPRDVFPGVYTLYAYLYADPNDTQPIATGRVDNVIINAGKQTYATVTLKLVELTPVSLDG